MGAKSSEMEQRGKTPCDEMRYHLLPWDIQPHFADRTTVYLHVLLRRRQQSNCLRVLCLLHLYTYPSVHRYLIVVLFYTSSVPIRCQYIQTSPSISAVVYQLERISRMFLS